MVIVTASHRQGVRPGRAADLARVGLVSPGDRRDELTDVRPSSTILSAQGGRTWSVGQAVRRGSTMREGRGESGSKSMRCMEIRGGNLAVEEAFDAPGLD